MIVGITRNTGASTPFKNKIMKTKKFKKCYFCGKTVLKGECCPCDILDPCGHAAKIAKQNKEMPKPIKEVMN